MARDQQIPRYEMALGNWKGWCTTARGNDQLAPRQLRYLLHIANGATQTQVASHEGVSVSTVAKGMAAVYHRLGFETGKATAAAALARAIRNGIITPLLILLTVLGPVIADDDNRRPRSGQRAPAKITARIATKGRPLDYV